MSPKPPWPAVLPRRIKHREALFAAGLGLAWIVGCSVYEDSLLSNDGLGTDAGRGGTVAGGEATAGGGSTPVGGASTAGTTSGSGGVSGETGVAGDAGSEAGNGGAPDEGGAGSAGMGAVAGSTSGGVGGAGGGSGGKGGAGGSGGKGGAGGSGGKGGAGGSGGSTGGAGMGGASGSGGSGGSAGAPRELATGKPATASSSQPDHTVVQGNDGNTTSRWAANNDTFPQWWRVDLGATRHVISVALRPEFADRTYSYLVETSTNDTLYTEQRSINGTAAVHNVDLPANVSARYVRITLTGTSGGPGAQWASFFEFSVTGN